MSGEEDERKCTHNSEKGEWEREMKSLKSQLEAKNNLIEEQRVELEAKDSQLKKEGFRDWIQVTSVCFAEHGAYSEIILKWK